MPRMWTGPDSISRWIEDFCLSEKGLYICVQKHLVGLIGVSEIDEKFHDRYRIDPQLFGLRRGLLDREHL